ncbi:MAG TPA: peptide deformylase [Sedimentisphaerales bacterium]|nr:peptide deformylase [Phycisphaerae bacterium]HON92256.1 peptide deformylase [Sedimentisphaerales bacterium]HQG48877.1 peptide deformylase [Sedimentisphaerales bacterium]
MIDIDKCKMTRFPAPVLRGKAAPVETIDDSIRKLVEKMTDLMIEHKGIGFAAPQAGVGLRLFIISLTGTRDNVRVYINPTVTGLGDLEEAEEGCLSVPGVWTRIRRHKRASVTATDLDGRPFSDEGEGLYARALQHEYDHIEGLVIVNRMSATARIAHRRQLKKLLEAGEGQV